VQNQECIRDRLISVKSQIRRGITQDSGERARKKAASRRPSLSVIGFLSDRSQTEGAFRVRAFVRARLSFSPRNCEKAINRGNQTEISLVRFPCRFLRSPGSPELLLSRSKATRHIRKEKLRKTAKAGERWLSLIIFSKFFQGRRTISFRHSLIVFPHVFHTFFTARCLSNAICIFKLARHAPSFSKATLSLSFSFSVSFRLCPGKSS